MQSMSNSWPEGVPETLWNYGGLRIQDIPQIPMMGVQFERQFVIAFVAGGLFLAYFAWDRFDNRPHDDKEFRYRVMKDLEVADLGGSAALWHAYLIYFLALLGLYVGMTFFGKLIVQTVNALDVVGIQVDESSLQFDSPLAPLMLAFGFAGFAPLIPQLRVAERWTFRRAYRAVGIPVRIHETTRNLIDLLDRSAANAYKSLDAKGKAGGNAQAPAGAGDALELTAELERKLGAAAQAIEGTWALEKLKGRPAKLENALTLMSQLELLVEWARGKRGAWPGSEVSDQVRDLEQDVADRADKLLEGLEKRLRENPASNSGVLPSRRAAAAAGTGDGVSERREKFVADTLAEAKTLRDELVAVLAVYVERDPTYVGASAEQQERQPIRDAGLRELLRRADPPNQAGTGPELGVLVYIGIAMIVYALFTWQEGHPLLSEQAMASSLPAVAATAALDGLRLLSIFWFPLVAAFAARQHYFDERKWVSLGLKGWSTYIEKRLIALGLALFVSVICLCLLAALWLFFIVKDVSGFQADIGFFLRFYGSMAIVTLPVAWFTLIAADARADGRKAYVLGLTSAFLVMAFQALHLGYWYGLWACTPDAVFLTDLFAGGCFAWYGGLDFIIMPFLAYLAAVVFGDPRSATVAQSAATEAKVAQTAAILALALAAICLDASGAAAQGTPGKPVVTIGFRADTEPFSYKVNADGGNHIGHQPLYKGFLADLCYWIFDGGDYSVAESEVTAADRFEKLMSREIDVLCDPVTMRFSDDNRTRAGTFSPIVFATGISYLMRGNDDPGPSVYIGYVENSTATKVLEHVCLVDLFRAVPARERAELATMCQTAMAVWRIENGKTDWDEARMAADHERDAFEKRKATGWRLKRNEESALMWSKTVEMITRCQEKNNCYRALIVRLLGTRCEDLENLQMERDRRHRTVYRFCPMKTHTELIDWFCKPRIGQDAPKTLVYLGDREIILGKLQTWNEQHTRKCEVENESGGEDLTYEPYALMMAKPAPQDLGRQQAIAELVQRRVYEFFSFGTLARAKFDTYFGGPRNKDRTMSKALAYLFLLNGVEDEREFLYPADETLAAD
jgi:hypothetical protein